MSIRFSGKANHVSKNVEQNIEIDYGNHVIFPINYKQDGIKFGLQMNELSKQYIAIRNENLDEFVGKFGIELPTSTELTNINQEEIFTEQELEQLKQIYMPVLQELADEKFSRVKSELNVSYTLELSIEEIKNIIIKILEITKQNTVVIDKINEKMLEIDEETEKIEATDIDDLIESINEEEIPDMPNLKITLVQNNKKLNHIFINQGENKISIRKNNMQNDLEYDINF